MRLVVCLLLGVVGTLGSVARIPRDDHVIDGEYVLRVREDLIKTQAQEASFTQLLESEFSMHVMNVFHLGSLTLVHVQSDDEAAVAQVFALPEVRYLEQNAYAYAAQTCDAQAASGCWGLDRIDQTGQLQSSDPLNLLADYMYGISTGAGVTAYICDSGIEYFHTAFEGRAVWGYTAIDMDGDEDLNGHGTHCAGTVGSGPYGVAKAVSMVAVKVLNRNGSGPWTSIIDGLQWILADHQRRQSESGGVMPKSVVNLSLGGGTNTGTDDAVQALIDGGVVVAIAAMNEDDNACSYTPARVPDALTIGAMDVSDTSATFSNWGACLDLFGPGVDVLSTMIGESTDVYSGTSMATPHVAGVVARYQSSLGVAPSPAAVDTWLKQTATYDVLQFNDNDHLLSPNIMLFVGCPL